ncbi:hypothetical protein AAG906_035784 [Vitis piasezkii]
MIQAKILSKNTNELVGPSTRLGKANQKSTRKPRLEREQAIGKKTKRKLDYNIHVVVLKTSLRLLPSLDFWRNQKVVYDAVRDIFLPHTWFQFKFAS